MQVRIGVQSVAKELVVETAETAEDVERAVAEAVEREDGVFTLRSKNGSCVLVPAAKLAYVEIGESASKSVGFGSF